MTQQPPEAAGTTSLLSRLRRSWARDGHLSVIQRLRKGFVLMMQLMRARRALRACDTVGARARVGGRLHVVNRGSIAIGDYFNVTSTWVPIELMTGNEGRIDIGDDVLINFGTVIAAASHVRIGSGSMVGPHCIISDAEMPESVTGSVPVPAQPIEIGRNVWLAGRVTIRPGVTIGDGAVVVAGSIVESDVPPNFMASGVPARALPRLHSVLHGDVPRPAPAAANPATARSAGSDLPLRGTLISDFALDDLMSELRSADNARAGHGSVHAELCTRGPLARCMTEQPRADLRDFAVVWSTPQGAVPSFGRVMNGERVSERELNGEIDDFCKLLDASAAHFGCIFVPTWTQPAHVRGQGLLDSRPGGVRRALAAMNLRLMHGVEHRGNIFVFDSTRWQSAVGRAGFNPRGWYLGGMAMARPLIAEAARDFLAALAALRQRQRRLLVLHADAVLWREDREGEKSDAIGTQAHVDYLHTLAALRRRGVLLAMLGSLTKFEMLQGIRSLPDGTLREDDFADCCTGDEDAAAQLAALALRTGVELDAMVYIDAHDAAHSRVRTALPQVLVPPWPLDKLLYPSALEALACFDAAPPQPSQRRLRHA